MDMWPIHMYNEEADFVFTLSRIVGLFYLSQRGDFSKSLAAIAFMIICTTSIISFAFVVLSLVEHSKSGDSIDSFWSATEIIRCCLDIFAMFVFMGRCLRKSNKLKRCYARVLYAKGKNTRTNKLRIPLSLFGVRTICFLIQYHYALKETEILDIFAGHLIAYLYITNVIIVMQMVTMAESVSSKYLQYLGTSRQNYLDTDRHSQTIDFLMETVEFYDNSLLLFSLRSLIELTSTCFYTLVTLNKAVVEKSKWHLVYTVVNIASVLTVLISLLILVKTCEKITVHVDGFYKELFRLMRESKTLCTNKKLCLYLTMKKTVSFTACGFFNIGYPLITSIIAAATTYLVILVQFSIPN